VLQLAKRSSLAGRLLAGGRSKRGQTVTVVPKNGTHVVVRFGRRDVEGVVVENRRNNRVAVELSVDGVDEPLVTTYALDEVTVN